MNAKYLSPQSFVVLIALSLTTLSSCNRGGYGCDYSMQEAIETQQASPTQNYKVHHKVQTIRKEAKVNHSGE